MDHSQHFICTGGCGGVAEDATAKCQAPDCAHFDKQLEPCTCTDGHHGRRVESSDQ